MINQKFLLPKHLETGIISAYIKMIKLILILHMSLQGT